MIGRLYFSGHALRLRQACRTDSAPRMPSTIEA